MVRTGDRCVRVGGGKSSGKKSGGGASSSSKSKVSSGKSNASIGGNPVCPRETPEWQKPITSFFPKTDRAQSTTTRNEFDQAESSTSKQSDPVKAIDEAKNINESRKESRSPEVSSSDFTVDDIETLCSLEGPKVSESDASSSHEDKSESNAEDVPDGNILEGSHITDETDHEIDSVETESSSSKSSLESPEYELLGETSATNSPVKKTVLEENKVENTNENKEGCKTPTVEKKRKSTINILTPKRIHT